MSTVDWEYGRITEQGIALMRSQLGVAAEVPGWNRLVTAEGVEHFALGIGDDNPLWWDDACASASQWAGRVAPPCYLYSHAGGPRVRPQDGRASTEKYLPGTLGLLASERWRWRRLARVGEVITASSALVDVQVREGSFGGGSVVQVERLTFHAGDEVVAELDQTIRRFERGKTRERGAYADRPLARWTAEDREMFGRQYDAEILSRQEGRARRIEDVAVGETIGPILKGPLTRTAMIGYLLGVGSSNTPGNRSAAAFIKRYPGTLLVHPVSGIADTLKAAHFDTVLAQASGLPAPYDFGTARVSWFSHLLTDWIGDNGVLLELEAEVRKPNLLGDITWLRGEVTGVDPKDGAVTIELTATNQLDEMTARGVATVRLPAGSSVKAGRPLAHDAALADGGV